MMIGSGQPEHYAAADSSHRMGVVVSADNQAQQQEG